MPPASEVDPESSLDPGHEFAPGDVVWASMAPVRGREQSGHRPAVVVASRAYLEVVDTLAIVVPVTTVDRGWPNHVLVTGRSGLDVASWAMTEQVRTISRRRVTRRSGLVDDACLRQIRRWLDDFLDLSRP